MLNLIGKLGSLWRAVPALGQWGAGASIVTLMIAAPGYFPTDGAPLFPEAKSYPGYQARSPRTFEDLEKILGPGSKTPLQVLEEWRYEVDFDRNRSSLEESLFRLEQLAEFDSDLACLVQILKGDLYLEHGFAELAVVALEKARQLNPKDTLAAYFLRHAYRALLEDLVDQDIEEEIEDDRLRNLRDKQRGLDDELRILGAGGQFASRSECDALGLRSVSCLDLAPRSEVVAMARNRLHKAIAASTYGERAEPSEASYPLRYPMGARSFTEGTPRLPITFVGGFSPARLDADSRSGQGRLARPVARSFEVEELLLGARRSPGATPRAAKASWPDPLRSGSRTVTIHLPAAGLPDTGLNEPVRASSYLPLEGPLRALTQRLVPIFMGFLAEPEVRLSIPHDGTLSEIAERLAESTTGARKRVVSLGVDDYGDFGALNYARADATRVAGRLRLLDFESEVLEPYETSKMDLLAALDRSVQEGSARDQLVVFLAGHGLTDKTGTPAFLLASDTGLEPVALAEVWSRLERFEGEATVILDACLNDVDVALDLGGTWPRPLESNVRLLSVADRKETYESDRLGSGLLTHALLTAIDQIDPARVP